MEETKTKKSSVLKLVVAFLAGVVLAVILLLATTGSLFTGEITRMGERIAPGGVKDIQIQICDDNCTLEAKIDAINRFLGNWNFTETFNEVGMIDQKLAIIRDELRYHDLTRTLSGFSTAILEISMALTDHTTAHSDGNYPPILGVHY